MKHEKRLTLNARKMDTREHAHEHLKKRLHLPDWCQQRFRRLRPQSLALILAGGTEYVGSSDPLVPV